MRRIEESVVVEAPADEVWAVLTDTAAYPDWNLFVKRLDGELTVGGRLSVRLALPGRKPMTFRPTVTAVDPGRRLEWMGRLGIPGVFDGRHSFAVEPVDASTTRFVQAEEFSGALVPFVGSTLRLTADGFAAMNRELRTRVLELGGADR